MIPISKFCPIASQIVFTAGHQSTLHAPSVKRQSTIYLKNNQQSYVGKDPKERFKPA